MSKILEENYNLPIQIIPDGLMIPGPHDTIDNLEESNETRGNFYLITGGSESLLVDAGFGLSLPIN